MLDRHFFGDVALAVLLSIPIAALARPEPVTLLHEGSSMSQHQAAGAVTPQDRPVSLLR